MKHDSRGFTFVELMIVVTIIMVLFSIALPNYWHSKEQASFTACVENRRTLEKAESQYLLNNNVHSVGLPSVLIEEDYANDGACCPERGSYYWVLYPVNDPRYRSEVGCSLHGADKEHNSNLDSNDKYKKKKPIPVPRRRVMPKSAIKKTETRMVGQREQIAAPAR